VLACAGVPGVRAQGPQIVADRSVQVARALGRDRVLVEALGADLGVGGELLGRLEGRRRLARAPSLPGDGRDVREVSPGRLVLGVELEGRPERALGGGVVARGEPRPTGGQASADLVAQRVVELALVGLEGGIEGVEGAQLVETRPAVARSPASKAAA
jgi:hypothetical protein